MEGQRPGWFSVRFATWVVGFLLLGGASAWGQTSELLPYQALVTPDGMLKSVGSDTMSQLMSLWGEGFERFHPALRFEIASKGSSTAPPAITRRLANVGPMSRPMREAEVEAFRNAYGYEPLVLPVAFDLLAIYVHRDNPIRELTLEQLDALFSHVRRRGFPTNPTTWRDLGLSGPYQEAAIRLYGRNSLSGTHSYFRENVLWGADFRTNVQEQPGSCSVVQCVGYDPFGIGYSGIGYRTADVKVLRLAKERHSPSFEPTAETGFSGDYPLSRLLYLVVRHSETEPMEPVVAEFLRYVYSREGQHTVAKSGYVPLPASEIKALLLKAGLN
ncbi:Phosphate ABC transporter, periplasmic phosphate-binding protein PstS [Planctomycetales bacterium 10988]|nr:Phosphate ABC transporter, periplasmic phosphate-binding protein PstS [Planctomycetales bacterium 10988]